MRRYFLPAVTFVAVLSASLTASSQESTNPSDTWFGGTSDAAPAAQPGATQIVVQQPAQTVAAPPPVVIIIIPGGEAPVVVERALPAPAAAPAPQPRVVVVPKPVQPKVVMPRRTGKDVRPDAGFNFHMQYLSFQGRMGRNSSPNAGLMGAGASVRFFRSAQREWQVGNEFFMGKDFSGFDRSEVGISVLSVRHLNPNSRLRFYGIGGANLWFGDVQSDHKNPLTPVFDAKNGNYHAQYGALGLQAGLGAEMRLTQSFSLHTDLLGLVRWRFASTQDAPEYFDRHTQEATNTFPAWLLRAGLTYWPDKKKK